MPVHTVKQDLLDQKLVKLRIEDLSESGLALPMFAVYLSPQPPAPPGDGSSSHGSKALLVAS